MFLYGNKIKCSTCGAKFVAEKSIHYVAKDPGEIGLMASLGKVNEPEEYDAFDCPICGCQFIAGKRKLKVPIVDFGDSVCEDDVAID